MLLEMLVARAVFTPLLMLIEMLVASPQAFNCAADRSAKDLTVVVMLIASRIVTVRLAPTDLAPAV